LRPRFFQTGPRGNRPCASLALYPTRPGQRTFTSKLSNMLGTPVPVDAQNAPTATWKTAQNAVSHSAHTHDRLYGEERTEPRRSPRPTHEIPDTPRAPPVRAASRDQALTVHFMGVSLSLCLLRRVRRLLLLACHVPRLPRLALGLRFRLQLLARLSTLWRRGFCHISSSQLLSVKREQPR